MGEKVAEPLGSRGCDQGYKGQLVAGYSWHPSEISAKPMVFNIPVKDLEDGIECTYSKVVDGTNLGEEPMHWWAGLLLIGCLRG